MAEDERDGEANANILGDKEGVLHGEAAIGKEEKDVDHTTPCVISAKIEIALSHLINPNDIVKERLQEHQAQL